MSGLGSLLLFCAWTSGLVVAFLTIRAFEVPVQPPGPRRRVPIALAGAVVVTLGLPWSTSPNGQITASGWLALDSGTVVALVLLATGVGAIAALPDRGGPRCHVHGLLLSLSLFGIVAGNWLIAASGGWGADLRWGATASLALAATLVGTEALPFLKPFLPRRTEPEVDLTRLNELRAY